MDETVAPRAGEELDGVALAQWMAREMPGCAVRGIRQFPAGHSNLTYLVETGDAEFVLRRPPFGSRVRGAHDMHREFRVLSALAGAYPCAPQPVVYCADEAVLGAPFYLMRRLEGAVIRRSLPKALAQSPAACRALSESMVDRLAELHAVDYRGIGLEEFGRPEGYVTRQIDGWTRRWRDAQTEPVPAMDGVAAWLAAHQPADSGAAVIHNDFKLDNLLVDAGSLSRVTGVLDWEMATIGDPLMDVGTALAYWIEPGDPPEMQEVRMSPTVALGFLSRREFVERYCERSGRPPIDPRFYHAYGLFKLAVILQQIYYRYRQGLTSDARFGQFGQTVAVLARRAAGVAEC